MSLRDLEALEYHSSSPAGKVSVVPTKPCRTQRDLSLAYTPGVAVPCLEIHRDPSLVYNYTAKGNLVAVVSNGTAVLGLGNIGPAAGKPVMEGKGVLFKRFADIDVFDLELATEDPKEVIRTCQLLEPTFGGINLEDIKAPECFEIEEELRRTLKIPVFHDDQHGTAIISGAALVNALSLVGKKLEDARIVFSGAGASAISCANHYIRLGANLENILMCDTKGVIHDGRAEGMNKYKVKFARKTEKRTLLDAMHGADVFIGLSQANCVTPEMLLAMADRPVVFALSNPDPEIKYETAIATRQDLILATGRSDYPNQVNNVLGFPFIFRGALDVRATAINDEMKLAATHALAELARMDVPDSVRRAYGVENMEFGTDYIIPKPFDSRVLTFVAPAVAKAAMETGVAQVNVDLDEYREQLERRLGKSQEIMRMVIHKAQREPRRVVFPEGTQDKILRAAQVLIDEAIARPVLIGPEDRIFARAEELRLRIRGHVDIVDPATSPRAEAYITEYIHLRQRKGVTHTEAPHLMLNPTRFSAMMVHLGDADAMIGGITQNYPDTIRPALEIIAKRPGVTKVSGMYMMITPKGQLYFIADTTVNIEPSAADLAEIAIAAADTVASFDIDPRIAMLSFSTFGSSRHPLAQKVAAAAEMVRQRRPELVVEGELMADAAVVPEMLADYPFCRMPNAANVLIAPNLEAGNIAYKLLMRLGGCEAIGPILMGFSKPVHVLQRGCEVNDIVHMAALAVVEAQALGARKPAPSEVPA
ncbi:NADP-dependent malic enzyme [Paludibaculum fermentans]|uniref:NADP-dependent malic enzyme n=1 Tax=Paludibaculum fermentans TaxID=1473598 RepID=A0A7S7SMN4_PALFE|nr:NADP-dependent malic enzyme [Paludibaculum fermentans]QOY91477.1 NADP-dependent malic enzyme [Paludibaculum fermentans]